MAIEVYKLEVGSNQSVFARTWTFYWEVGNQSGRNQVEISGDLANSLAATGDWFYLFREMWLDVNLTRIFRIRKVWPTIEPWNDYYWRFHHLTGRAAFDNDFHNIRMRVVWYTGRYDLPVHCTYVDCTPFQNVKDNLIESAQLEIVEEWASQHDSIQTTSNGDQFRPAVFSKYGGYDAVLGHWVDRRPVLSRRHLWKG